MTHIDVLQRRWFNLFVSTCGRNHYVVLKGAKKTRGRSECQTGEQRILSVLSTVVEMQRCCGALGKVMIHNRFNL